MNHTNWCSKSVLHSKSVTSKVAKGENNKNLQSIYLHLIKMTKLITWLWHCCQKREKWNWNWSTQINKRKKLTRQSKRGRSYKREIFIFGIILLFWPSLMKALTWLTSLIWWSLSLVCHQCQRGRLLISDWNKLILREIFEWVSIIILSLLSNLLTVGKTFAYLI